MTAPDNALVLAFVEQFGVPVFPVTANAKNPLTPHGFKDATRDHAQIQEWAKQHPGCNWGMPTGALSGFAVLDVDIRPDQGKDGDAVLRQLEDAHGALPETAQVLTPSGGRHYWFRTNGSAMQSGTDKLGIGLDVKADGGYVVIPPSAINGRAYTFEASSDPADVGFAEMPAWLVTMLTAKRERPKVDNEKSAHGATDWLESIARGEALHDSLRDWAAHLASKGLDFATIVMVLESAMNGSQAPRDGRWRARFNAIPGLVNSAIEKFRSPIHAASFSMPEPITLAEWTSARRTPVCIVQDYLFADVGVFISPGGMGKTTLKLFEAIHIALGLPLYGLTIHTPGAVLILTAEDSREMLIAVLRMIAQSMYLPDSDIATVMDRVRICDVSGSGFKLTEVNADVVKPSQGIDLIITACQTIKPVLIVIDPAVSFGVGESRVNDAEQGLVEAGRKLRRGLNCCVEYIHHTGKQNARDKVVDQYAGRGGSAFADGARMVHVLQSLTPAEWLDETGTDLLPGETGLRLARPKMSYCPPQGDILIRRKGYHFAHVARVATSKQAKLAAAAEQVFRVLESELRQGRYHSRNTLESADTGLKRNDLRAALAWLTATMRIEEREAPHAGKGGKHKYLHPIGSPSPNGEATQKNPENDEKLAAAKSVIGSPPPLGNSPAANLPPPDEPSFPYASPDIDGEPTANRANQ